MIRIRDSPPHCKYSFGVLLLLFLQIRLSERYRPCASRECIRTCFFPISCNSWKYVWNSSQNRQAHHISAFVSSAMQLESASSRGTDQHTHYRTGGTSQNVTERLRTSAHSDDPRHTELARGTLLLLMHGENPTYPPTTQPQSLPTAHSPPPTRSPLLSPLLQPLVSSQPVPFK